MLMLGLVTTLLFTALPSATTAIAATPDECTPRNIYEAPSSPLHEIPIGDQGETALCYAYTVSQLTEAYLRETGVWKFDGHLDPMWVALLYKGGSTRGLRIRSNELGYGFFKTAFYDLESGGICDPAVFSEAALRFKRGSKIDDSNFFLLFELVWEIRVAHPEYFASSTSNFPAVRAELAKISYLTKISERAGSPAEFERDTLTLFATISAVKTPKLTNRDKTQYLRESVFGACKGAALWNPKLPTPTTRGLAWESNAELKAGIDRMLNAEKPLPIGIGYCAGIYDQDQKFFENASRRDAALPRLSKPLRYTCGAHYSIIAGRRKNEAGVCQYLVRNSFGKDFWTRRYECLCEKGDHYEACRYNAETSPSTDRVVGCWIDEEPLLNSLYDVSTLSPAEVKILIGK